MSLVTRSRLRNRVYPRAFDHDEAIRLRAENPALWTYKALSEHFGVSSTAVERVIRPELRERMSRRALESARRQRKPCLGGCGQLVWQTTKGRSGLCARCVAARQANPNVREHELRCLRCGQWKPDSEFWDSEKHITRRGHKTHCRACGTEIRREFRRKHPEQEAASARRYYHEVRRERRGVVAEYIVLKQVEGRYQEVETVEAPTSDAAIEKVAVDEGSYVAVLVSRFDVVTVAPIRSLRVVRDE